MHSFALQVPLCTLKSLPDNSEVETCSRGGGAGAAKVCTVNAAGSSNRRATMSPCTSMYFSAAAAAWPWHQLQQQL